MQIDFKLRELKEDSLILMKVRERLGFLKNELEKSSRELAELTLKVEKEAGDVRELEQISLSGIIASIMGNKAEKLELNQREYIHAKSNYDTIAATIEDLKEEIRHNEEKEKSLIPSLSEYKRLILQKAEIIKENPMDKTAMIYEEMELKRSGYLTNIRETEEAVEAGERLMAIIIEGAKELERARSIGSFDIWFKGNVFSSMAKHDHINYSKRILDQLPALIKQFNREILDIKSELIIKDLSIDSGTVFFDIWFDNIFTDISVQNTIVDVLDKVSLLSEKVQDAIDKIEIEKSDTENKLIIIDAEIDHLIEGYGVVNS